MKRFFTRQLNRFFAMPSQEGKKISLHVMIILISLRIPGYLHLVVREENMPSASRASFIAFLS